MNQIQNFVGIRKMPSAHIVHGTDQEIREDKLHGENRTFHERCIVCSSNNSFTNRRCLEAIKLHFEINARRSISKKTVHDTSWQDQTLPEHLTHQVFIPVI